MSKFFKFIYFLIVICTFTYSIFSYFCILYCSVIIFFSLLVLSIVYCTVCGVIDKANLKSSSQCTKRAISYQTCYVIWLKDRCCRCFCRLVILRQVFFLPGQYYMLLFWVVSGVHLLVGCQQ